MYIYQELAFGAQRAFRTVIPDLHDRIPLSWSNALYPFACYVPFIFMAYLSRRPDTYLIRLLLLPTAIFAILAAAYRFVWTIPELNVYNWGQCLFAAVSIAKTLEFALTKEGMLKVGEVRPGELKGKTISNGHAVPHTTPQSSIIPTWLSDAVEVSHTLRGLQFKFGQGVHIPAPTRPLARARFLRATFFSFTYNFLVVDLLESLIKLFPGVGTPAGGTMFYPSLPLFQRYATSTLIHMLTGSALLAGFGMVYDLVTLVAVGLVHSPPTAWPPIMDDPWSADSMHAFWARHWHQLLRQTFLVLGGYPGKILTGGSDIGMVFGAFVASGLFHECAMYSMARGFDAAVPMFFALQGPVLVGERVWRRVTGRRVSGWGGRLWVYFMMFVGAQPMVNAWHRRGLGGGMVIPPFFSPVRLILVPLVQRLLQSYLRR